MATTAAIDVVMPQMGVSVSEGTITKWLKQEGETVEADESLLEISTDKVDTEVPSPGSGIVQQILVQEGETVEVGTKLAVIAPEGAEAPAAVEETPPEPATQEAAAEAEASSSSEGETPVPQSAPPEPEPEPAPAPVAADGNGGGEKTFVSPVVARIASEHGVDVGQVSGTGRGGRVTKKDILAFVESGGQQEQPQPQEEQAQAAPAAPPAPPEPAPAQPEAPPEPAPAPAAPAAPHRRRTDRCGAAGEPSRARAIEPMTAMRRGIAEHMRRSLDTSAHVTSAIEVDMSKRGRDPQEAEEASTRRATASTRPTSPSSPAQRSRPCATTRGSTASCAAIRSSPATTSTSASRSS